jgi:hypothetical protein
VAKYLFDMCLEYGCLFEQLVSDQGTEFLAAVIQDFCDLMAIHRINTSGYHPQSNGVAESANQQIVVAERSWAASQLDNWHKGLKALQLALRTRPRADTGLTPFFCLYGREARLPWAALQGDDSRSMNLTAEVEMQLDQMRLAERVVDEAMGPRERAMERRNEQVQRTLQVESGDWVWVRRQAAEKRAYKIDSHHYTGPWLVLAPAGPSGLSFTCRMMGSRVKTKSVHVEHMKPYKHRPLALTMEDTVPLVQLTPEQLASMEPGELCNRIIDRNAVGTGNKTWQYKLARADGTTSEWVTEADLLKVMPPWVLDTFHAMYELRRGDDMPLYARRPEPPASRRRSTEDALAIYPKGTQVVRPEQAPGQPLRYVWGKVHGYLHPYWRVRYDDGEWEELNLSEARAAMEQAQRLRARATESGDTATKPNVEYATLPGVPPNFGAPNVGDMLRYYDESSGWAKGQITACTRAHRGDKYSMRVRWLGETRDSSVQLRHGYYTTNPNDINTRPIMPRNHAWNVMCAHEAPPAAERTEGADAPTSTTPAAEQAEGAAAPPSTD